MSIHGNVNDALLAKVNAGKAAHIRPAGVPVMATPAAFVAGVVSGAKVSAALVAAASAGAAVGKAVAS